MAELVEPAPPADFAAAGWVFAVGAGLREATFVAGALVAGAFVAGAFVAGAFVADGFAAGAFEVAACLATFVATAF
ncbi:hypothetical protein QYH69_31685 [Paraburkholderia sp. SARCC-3016]|nr:hypothetical protein [Paraburkholderia sp. SARCC-3016]